MLGVLSLKSDIIQFKGMLIGITGGIASGKSTVADIFEKKGAYVIDFDCLARQVVEPDKPALKKIIDYFGENVLLDNGFLNRKKLSDIVFNEPKKRKILESFTHTAIYKEFVIQVNNIFEKDSSAVIFAVVPLLIESGIQALFDKIIVVYIPEKLQAKRLIKRDNINKEKALARVTSQLCIEQKLNFTNYVINNSKTLEETKVQADKLWFEIINMP